ncbi:hypothetical protein [Pseudonocardia alni]|jgi:hypothetical protein
MTEAITVEGLVKSFGSARALDGLDGVSVRNVSPAAIQAGHW